MIDSLVAEVTGLDGRPVAGKLVEEARFRAEDVTGSLFLEGCLAAQHGLLAGCTGDLRLLSCRGRSNVLVFRRGRCWGQRLLAVVDVVAVIRRRLIADR